MTYSIAGFCPTTGMLGTAITSSSICVASRCSFVQSHTGVALTQNITNPDLGPLALKLFEKNQTPEQVIEAMKEADTDCQWRQLGVLDAKGEGAMFSGKQALGIHSTASGKNCIAMGNLLHNSDIPQAMINAFEKSSGHLADRLLIALEAGAIAGGELGPEHSAGLTVHADPKWPIVDLRVDWHIEPINELRMIWKNYEPQMNAYITRAIDPANSDSYGVPGDL